MKAITKKTTKTLKEALYDTIHKSPCHSIAAIAEQLDMAESYLYRSALPDPDTDGPNASGVRFPLKKVVPLVLLTGDHQILDVMEFQVGRVAVPLPKPQENQNQDEIRARAMFAVVQFGDLIREVNDSIADGVISEKEQELIDKEGRATIQAICALLSINAR